MTIPQRVLSMPDFVKESSTGWDILHDAQTLSPTLAHVYRRGSGREMHHITVQGSLEYACISKLMFTEHMG